MSQTTSMRWKLAISIELGRLSCSGDVNPICHVFFDLDGTLTDSRLGIIRCIQYALVKLSRRRRNESELETFIGAPLRDAFAVLLETDDDALLCRALNLYRDRYSRIGLYENDVYDGVPDMLQGLRDCGHNLLW